jgi:hypothetical protein
LHSLLKDDDAWELWYNNGMKKKTITKKERQKIAMELNRAAQRKSEERNRDIIARGGPGDALPTSSGLGQVDTSYKGANSERGTSSGPSMRS